MSLKAKLPGMREESGHRVRNVLFGIGYAFLALMVLGSLVDGGESETGEPEIDAATEAEAAEGDAAEADEGDGGSDSADESSEAAEGDDSADADVAALDDASDDEASEAATDGGETATAAQAAESETESQGLTPADMETMLINEFGLDLYVMDNGDGVVETDYFSYAGSDEQQLAEELGMIAGAYSALVSDGYETDEMVINVKAPNAEAVGEFRVDASDAQAYADGKITAQEYAQIVLETGEVYN